MPESTVSHIQGLRIWLLFCECVTPKNLTLIPAKAKENNYTEQEMFSNPVLWLFFSQTNLKNN
jgi:hypothetical protein